MGWQHILHTPDSVKRGTLLYLLSERQNTLYGGILEWKPKAGEQDENSNTPGKIVRDGQTPACTMRTRECWQSIAAKFHCEEGQMSA